MHTPKSNSLLRQANSTLAFIALTAAMLTVAGCSGGGGDEGSKPQTGMLKIGLSDAPVDAADAVVVQFTGVELKPANGEAFSVDFAAKTIDVLTYQGTDRVMLLDGEQVPAGDYQWMRLKVNADPNVAGDSYITVNGAQCEMRIPSGDETGLKLIRGFTVGVGTTTDFTIDFDLRHSVVRPPGQDGMTEQCDGQAYFLKPVLRIVDNLQVGTITGTIDPTLVSTQCTDASTVAQVAPGNLYLFGPYSTGATPPVPDDFDLVDADGADALASAMVKTRRVGQLRLHDRIRPGRQLRACVHLQPRPVGHRCRYGRYADGRRRTGEFFTERRFQRDGYGEPDDHAELHALTSVT